MVKLVPKLLKSQTGPKPAGPCHSSHRQGQHLSCMGCVCRHKSYLSVAKLMLDLLCVPAVQAAAPQQRKAQPDTSSDRLLSGAAATFTAWACTKPGSSNLCFRVSEF